MRTQSTAITHSSDSARQLRLAPLWKRVVAFGIDITLLVALYSALIGLVNQVLRLPVKNSPILERGLSLVITPDVEEHFWEIVLVYSLTKLAVIFPYFALMESSRRQATLGKMVVGIQVADTSGRRVSLARACGRSGAKLLSGVLLVGYAVAVLTPKRQALHDLLAGTLVIVPGEPSGQTDDPIWQGVTSAAQQLNEADHLPRQCSKARAWHSVFLAVCACLSR